MENPFAVLVQVVGALEGLGIQYVIVGSIASSIHGEYRASADIDIVADVQLDHVEPLVESLKAEYYVDDLMIRRAISEGRSFNLIHLNAIFKVDVFVPTTELAQQQLIRREKHRLQSSGEQQIWVATAEDTILAKLHWYRLGREISELQWRDVQGIMATRGKALDYRYLDEWAEKLGLVELLRRALTESI